LLIVVGVVSLSALAQESPQSKQPAQISKKTSAQQSSIPAATHSQPSSLPSLSPTLLSSLHWRSIGPYRGGRTRAVSGVPSQPSVFYIGVCNGGVWKTNDYGRTWKPIFDDQPTGSIGAIAVAPSDPNIVYVASGEGLHRPDLSVGDGIYKSTDAGKTWTHLGLRDGQQIPGLAVDPRDPNKVFAAVAGHPYGPNTERGVYRSTDGGQNFQKVLPTNNDENIGAADVLIDPSDSSIVYATLWEARQGPWENGAWNGSNGGIFKAMEDLEGATAFGVDVNQCPQAPGDGGRPQNALTGQLFIVNSGSSDITVPSTYKNLRLWRNTAVASLGMAAAGLAPSRRTTLHRPPSVRMTFSTSGTAEKSR
jgi:hypothetical protein